MAFHNRQRELALLAENWKVTDALFSKSGFTAEAKPAMSNCACQWIDLEQLDRDLRQG